MTNELDPYGALARFLRHSAGKLGEIESRLRELGLLDDAVERMLVTLRGGTSRWASRVENGSDLVDEDEATGVFERDAIRRR